MNPTAVWQMKDLAERPAPRPFDGHATAVAVEAHPRHGRKPSPASKVGISDVYAASKLGEAEQAELLRLKFSGASRDAIEQAGRKSRNGKATAIKLSRVKIAMPQGASVVVSGNDLGMPELVELLSQTLAAARKAAEQFDVKTFQSMMRDKAKGVKHGTS